MFRNLRQGMPLYVLTKGNEPQFDKCEVISRTEPVVPYGQNGTTFVGGQQYLAQPNLTVDVQVRKDNGDTVTYQKLPADADIADFGTNGVVVSSSSEAIQNEIDTLRKQSLRVLESVDKHKKIVATCDKMLSDLNPQIKQEATRSRELESLRNDVNDLRDDLSDIKSDLKGLLSKIANVKRNKEE